jgi:hypothetical protein
VCLVELKGLAADGAQGVLQVGVSRLQDTSTVAELGSMLAQPVRQLGGVGAASKDVPHRPNTWGPVVGKGTGDQGVARCTSGKHVSRQ